MKLKELDQLHVSAVKSDSLRPGEEFEVSEELGSQILKSHPTLVEQVGGEKAEVVPQNKAESAPANKARKGKKQAVGE